MVTRLSSSRSAQRRRLGLRLLLGVVAPPIVLAGCAEIQPEEMAILRAQVHDAAMTIHKVADQLKMVNDISAGGDVAQNEPVTGWILAAGYAMIPLCFLVYTIAKRTRLYRWLAGSDCSRPPNGGAA